MLTLIIGFFLGVLATIGSLLLVVFKIRTNFMRRATMASKAVYVSDSTEFELECPLVPEQ